MSDPIGPGDWVECIRQGKRGIFHLGAIYCVEAVERPSSCEYGCIECLGVHIVGTPRPSDVIADMSAYRDWWPACTFAPVYRPKQELIESLKAPPKRVKTPSPEKVST